MTKVKLLVNDSTGQTDVQRANTRCVAAQDILSFQRLFEIGQSSEKASEKQQESLRDYGLNLERFNW